MEGAPRKFPFSTSFQFRDDERAGLEALFERVFFDVPFRPEAQRALVSTLYVDAPEGQAPEEPSGKSAPQAIEAAEGAAAREANGGDTETVTMGEAARYVLLCRGADGIGKTRIFRHLRERACEKQIPVYEVYHRDVEGVPFKPFLYAIQRILEDHDPGAILQKKYRYSLEALIPEAFGHSSEARTGVSSDEGSDAEPSEVAPCGFTLRASLPECFEAEKVRIFDAITQLLLEVATRKPFLLMVHDLHWSDQSTIELLRYIGRNLQLRNSPVRRHSPEQLLFEAETGPEVDGFESEEWHTLARKSAQVAGYLGGWPSRHESTDGEASGPAKKLPPARLLILTNYRGFPERGHYLEEAISALGTEPFAYHAEFATLGAEEAASFIQQSVDGVELVGHPLEVRPDAVEAIYEATQGFPSFTQELFRALYLRSSPAEGNGTPPWVWTGERVRKLLEETSLPSNGEPESTEGGDAGSAEGAAKDDKETEVTVLPSLMDPVSHPLERRHAILRLRLKDADEHELRVLQAITVARRPLTATFLAAVLRGEQGGEPSFANGVSPADVLNLLQDLEQRGLVERDPFPYSPLSLAAQAGEDPAARDSYFFRLWDYARVLEETLDDNEKRKLHQRIGEEICALRAQRTAEEAFEIYYHLYRGLDARSALDSGQQAARRLWRSFAFVKARRVYQRLVDVLTREEDGLRRVSILEDMAKISIGLRETKEAEEFLKRVQEEGASILSPDRRAELYLLEAEAVAATDPARGLKILGRVPRFVGNENSRLGALLQLCTARLRLARQDVKRAINFCLKGITICQKVGSVPELGELYRVLATAFYRKGDYSHAVDNYLRALNAFEEMERRDASVETLDDLGRVYLERGNYFRAARYLYKALEIRQRLNDVAALCRSYDQLALVYQRSGDDIKTIENLNRTVSLRERTGDFAGLNPTLSALGDLYRRLGNYEHSLAYFNWEVENSQRLGETEGLVEAFCKLGRLHFELGDLRKAHGLSTQVSILATEFKLKDKEADGALLSGELKAFELDWPGAEKDFRLAADFYSKLGHRRRESAALLSLAEVKFARELYDESLKLTSKGQLLADEVKALDLQVKALTLKGNIYRFLKGGNEEKSSEFLQKAVELSQDLSDANVLFELFYSLARVSHSQREFAEAANYYGKAELILKKIGDELDDELSPRFYEDRRRKVFAEDLERFRRESQGRMQSGGRDLREAAAHSSAGLKERPCGVADYKDLSARLLRLHTCLNQLHFHDLLLREALELTGADRGFILRVQNRQYIPAAFQGFGKNPAQHPEFMAASHVAQESIRKGRSILASGQDAQGARDLSEAERRLQLGGLVHRSILSIPFMTEERIFGGVYLDRPVAIGQFASRDQVLLESYAQHAAVALQNRREFETTIREPLTGLYTPSYFVDRLREAYRLFNLHGKAFAILAYYVPTLEETVGDAKGQLGGKLSQELGEVLPPGVAICWGNPILSVLLEEADAPLAGQYAEAGRHRLQRILSEEVPLSVLPAESHYQQGAEIYFEARHRLLPQECDPKISGELRHVFAQDVTLRDAKKLLEKYKIEMTLRKTGGNITHAARELGVHRPQLSNLLKRHDLRRELFEPEPKTEVPESTP